MRQLQGLDASFVALETPNSPMHIGSVLFFNPATAPGGFVRFKDILGQFESRLQLSKIVRQRLVKVPLDLDHPYWVEDENFDLEYHIRHVALPKPGDWRQLCILAARIFARPLDLSRPPWEITVIEGLDNIPDLPRGSFGMVTKVHHAAIDGMSGIDLMEALFTASPDAPPPPAPDSWQPEQVPSAGSLLARGWAHGLVNPFSRISLVARLAPGLTRVVRGLAARDFSVSKEMLPPRTRFNAAVSPHRVIEGRRFELAELKAVRHLVPGAKLNDVFLAGIGGGLRKYLAAKAELPDKSLTAMTPISVRAGDGPGASGNQVAAMIAPLGTHIADPTQRLGYVFGQTVNSKALTDAVGARNLCDISKVSPSLLLALGARLYTGLGLANRMTLPFNTIVTNVPGPPVPLYTAGALLESMMGLICLTDGMGLAHVVQSYVDEATVSFTADRNLMDDPGFYAECLEEGFRELIGAAAGTAAQLSDPKLRKGRRGPAGGKPAPAAGAQNAGPEHAGRA